MISLRPSSGLKNRKLALPSTRPALTLRCISPNRLIVDEATSDDNSVATMNPATMEALELFRGDTIIVRYALLGFFSHFGLRRVR